MAPSLRSAEAAPSRTRGFQCPPGSHLELLQLDRAFELACFDANAQRTGPAATFDESGALTSLGHFDANEPEGFFSLWGEPAAAVIHFTARHGVPDGIWEEFDAEGNLAARIEFRSGTLHGPAVWFHPFGSKRIEGQHVDGEMQGEWREWFRNGTHKSSCNYVSGQLNGLCQRWDASGVLRAEGVYQANQSEADFRYWNAKGELLDSR